ncbi:hypothetical protein CEP54_002813 [Fusarium duplospermum]|uniref:Carrier domain-containing protein n=1 Tax=Fusarium duplospermum TaxID=1325734 RepID=A0A428QSW3_9HYPO|nr:hypothetical protein CEP54_002813 [Fusarium duplospermum]
MDVPRSKFGLVRLPALLMMQIFDQLPKASHRALALVCKESFEYFCPSGKFPKLDKNDLFELLLLLEQGRPDTFVCFNCLKLSLVDRDGQKGWQTQRHQICGPQVKNLWASAARSKFGHRYQQTRIELLPEGTWKPEAQGPEITFAEAHLVMNWHRTGGQRGLPISTFQRHYSFIRLISLEKEDTIDDHFPLEKHQPDDTWTTLPSKEEWLESQKQRHGAQTLPDHLGASTPWAFTHDYEAMVINDELYLSRTHHVKGPLVTLTKLLEVLETLTLPICEHIRCYEWPPYPREPWESTEGWSPEFILRHWRFPNVYGGDDHLTQERDGVQRGWAYSCHFCFTDYIASLSRATTTGVFHLEVSQPNALISIGKTTEENAPLAPLVHKYIDEDLVINVRILELRLSDAGLLSGGAKEGVDIFDSLRSKISSPPNIVGLDSNPTLSFTSGTKRFNLSSESFFACPSGIAHDPIQRARETERVDKTLVTDYDSPPAMGQILVGGATAKFPALKQVFFVGDVLTTRNCKALHQLGPSSSTCWELPRQVRGVGEIYFRAAGLAEGYFGDPQKTAEKFVDNWLVDNAKWVEADRANDKGEPWLKYYKGPRDRLYRTGDLGQNLTSGAVRVSGRIDSQVKIRSFQIELNEIDANLGESPLVRDVKILVRRDRNEEPTLNHEDIEDEGVEIRPTVVYLKRFRRMQAEVRDHLKSRLPAHSVPSIYIMLQKLPLNPNGKVDFPNLPFPDAAARTEDASEEDLKSWEVLSVTKKTLATQWSTLIPGLNTKTIRPESNFFDCGGDSLLAQQLLLNIRKSLGSQVDRLRSGQAATVDKAVDTAYAKSFDELISILDDKYQSADPDALSPSSGATFFLTGATGFLGAYLVKEILGRKNTKLIAHIRGAKGLDFAKDRLTRSLKGYGEGITREDIGRYLRFLAEIKFMPLPIRRGRELPPIAAEIAQAQAQWGAGGRGGAA